MGKSGRVNWPNETEPSLTAAEIEAEKRRKPSRKVEEEDDDEILGLTNGKEGSFTTKPSIIGSFYSSKKFNTTAKFRWWLPLLIRVYYIFQSYPSENNWRL